MNQIIAIFVVMLVSCVYVGSALECYECSPLGSPNNAMHCMDPFDGKVEKRQCMGHEVCMKQTTPEVKLGNNVIPATVSRGCGDKALCDIGSEIGFCGYCSSDLCNSAVPIVPSFTVIALYIIKCIFL